MERDLIVRIRGAVVAAALAVAAMLAFAAPASAAPITSVLTNDTISGQAISCPAQSDGVRVCHGTDGGLGGTDLRLKSFDGTPLEVYVILPPAPTTGTDGSYPLVVQSHGWGGSAGGPSANGYSGPTADAWAKAGYAVLQLTARGWGDSCGTAQSRLADPAALAACTNGYIRLDDERYEVRDIQTAVGYLVDEGVVDPARIGATGPSYGGGVSLELATLKDRVMNADGSLSPWKSPNGTPLSLAAGAPVVPWSDLVYSLMPNGRTLDYQVTSPTADLSPIGVEKQSFVSGLYLLGQSAGYYSPPGLNPGADLTTWFTAINAGEPYDSNPVDQMLATQIARYHSAYYLLDGAYGTARQAPAPLLVANGFTDDLFPVDEAIRYYNLERSLYPSDPISLFDWDGGHMRGQNKAADNALLSARIQAFFDHYVKGSGPQPALDVTALTQTCPSSAPSGGPYEAPTWAALHPGEVDYSSKATQTILSTAGSPAISKTFDPVLGGGACATAAATDQGTGVASYRLPAATGSGYTLLGSATVIADLNVTGKFAYIAERLLDVDPATNTETLVARGLYRIDDNAPDGVQVFQLHPGAWHFAAGHIPKLELLGQDTPYSRASNGVFSISVSDLQLRLPVHETAGSNPAVTPPQPVVTPHPVPCSAQPSSAINRKGSHASRTRLTLTGTATETPCAQASATTQRAEHVRRVYVVVSTRAPHHRCRFLKGNGRLSHARSCRRTIQLTARGTTQWSLRLRVHLVPGRYLVRTTAVDGRKARQPKAASLTLTVSANRHRRH